MKKITVTKRKIDHEDPKAAGFTDGYWWVLEVDGDRYESGAASREEARAAAEAAAAGFPDAA